MSNSRFPIVIGALVALALASIPWWWSDESSRPGDIPAVDSAREADPAPNRLESSIEAELDARASRIEVEDAPRPAVGANAELADVDSRPVVARGFVSWPDGAPSASVDVVLFDSDGESLELATTAVDGGYELRCGEPLAAGWSVGADDARIASDGSVAYTLDCVPDLPRHLPGEPPIEADLVLGHAPDITGRVHDRATGAPIESAEIVATSELPAWSQIECSALSGPDGSYRLVLGDLPPRRLIVWCRSSGRQARVVGPQDIPFARTPGQSRTIDFALDRPVSWRGRVISARDGSPISGATITIGNQLEAFSHHSDFETSDEDGCFELELPDVPIDQAWVHAAAPGCGPVALRGVRPGHPLQIELGEPISIVGLVIARGDGQPIESANVQVVFGGETLACDGGLCDETSTEADGSFELRLESAPVDDARITVEVPGYPPFDARLSAVVLAAEPGRRTVRIELDSGS